MPEVKVEGYKELRADKPVIAVTDEEVEQSLKGLQEQHANFTAVEGRPLAEGDFAQASSMAFPKMAKVKPVHMDEVLVEIGGKNTMPEFTENLRGASAGEERNFEVVIRTMPARSVWQEEFQLHRESAVHQAKTLPELNDDFAKELGEFANLEEVRARIREGMEAERKHDGRARSQRQAGGGTGEAQRV